MSLRGALIIHEGDNAIFLMCNKCVVIIEKIASLTMTFWTCFLH
jgi:hypothetical protein